MADDIIKGMPGGQPSIDLVFYQLTQLTNLCAKIQEKMDINLGQMHNIDVWRAQIDARLMEGNKIFSDLDKKYELNRQHCQAETERLLAELNVLKQKFDNEVQRQNTALLAQAKVSADLVAAETIARAQALASADEKLKNYIKRENVLYLLSGVALASGGGAIGLMKLFGG